MRCELCKEQQHIQKHGTFRGYGVAEAPLGFQADWPHCVYFFLSSFVLDAHLEFTCKFLYLWGHIALTELSPDVYSKEAGVSFVALGILEPQTARHWLRSAAISCHLTNQLERSLQGILTGSHNLKIQKNSLHEISFYI
jgi:hypothetical protein